MKTPIISDGETARKAMKALSEILGINTEKITSLTVTFEAGKFVRVKTEFMPTEDYKP